MNGCPAQPIPVALKWKTSSLVSAAVIVFAAVLPYLYAARYEFVYDEIGQIAENPFIQQPGNILSVLQGATLNDGSVINGRRPVVLLTYFVDFALWQLNPFGWRLTNALLHSAAAVALYALVLLLAQVISLREGRLVALAASLVFALHPLNSEAVHVAAFRPDILATLFSLLAVGSALRVQIARNPMPFFFLSALFSACAIGAKETALVLPVVTLLVCGLVARRSTRNSALLWLPAAQAVMGSLYVWMCLRPPPPGTPPAPFQAILSPESPYALHPPANLLTAPWLLALYLRLLAVPYPLIMDRVIDRVCAFTDLRLWSGVGVTAALLAVAWRLRRRQPLITIGIAWLIAFWLPASNIVPLFNPLAERYAYPLCAGYSLIFACGATCLSRKWRAFFALILLVYLALLLNRLSDYRSSLCLWQQTLKRQPNSARACVWLGLHYKHSGQRDLARQMFQRARRINPWEISAAINEAILLGESGRLTEALELLQTAVKLRPDSALAHANLAYAYYLAGNNDAAMRHLHRALALDPRAPAVKRLGRIMNQPQQ